MNRRQEQADLLQKLGDLLAPLREIVKNPDRQTAQTRARALATVMHDFQVYITLLERFSRSEPGRNYQHEYRNIYDELNSICYHAPAKLNETKALNECIESHAANAVEHLLNIPTDEGTEVLEANSPFQAFCKLKAYFETIGHRLIWADPYMSADLFHRYLADLPPTIEIVLVTSKRVCDNPAFQSVSRLFAAERGPAKYRLIKEASNHDRWLRCDDQLYHLGGSAKDAGGRSPFTISKLDPTPDNFKKLDDLIANGQELFGPSNPVHP